MITNEQMSRVQSEMKEAARCAVSAARSAERILEDYTYPRTGHERMNYDPMNREKLWMEFREADYLAESRSWIVNLIRESISSKQNQLSHVGTEGNMTDETQ